MKTKLLLFVLVAIAGFGISANAQVKIAHADVYYILGELPEYKQAESTLEAHIAQLRNQGAAKAQTYQEKVAAFQNLPATTPQADQQKKMTEIQTIEQELQEFEGFAQQSIEKKQGELLAPLYQKIGEAITAVSEENGFDFVLSSVIGGNTDIVLYAKEEYDITLLVLKKLGVTVE